MPEGLNRRYRLEFGRSLNLSEVADLSEIQLFVPDRDLTVQSRILTEHRIEFIIEKSGGASPNKAELTLTNISDEMWQFINASVGQEVYVKLEAATNEDPLKIIGLGQVQKVLDTFEAPNRRTKVVFADGYTPVKEAKSEISFPANEPYRNIVRALQQDMRLPFGVYEELPIVAVSQAPWSWSGSTHEGLRKVAKDLNYRYSVTDGKINFVDRHASRLTEVAEYDEIRDGPTGLIGSPATLDKSSGVKQGSSDVATGIRFKVLLNGSLEVDSLVIINTRQFSGTYRISKLKHHGDWRGNDWYTECEALKVPDVRNPVFDLLGV